MEASVERRHVAFINRLRPLRSRLGRAIAMSALALTVPFLASCTSIDYQQVVQTCTESNDNETPSVKPAKAPLDSRRLNIQYADPNQRFLTAQYEFDDIDPALSPQLKENRRLVVFARIKSGRSTSNKAEKENLGTGLFIVDPENPYAENQITNPGSDYQDEQPDWSDTGEIIFIRKSLIHTEDRSIFSVNLDGTNLRHWYTETDSSLNISAPLFSPNAERVAFNSANSTLVLERAAGGLVFPRVIFTGDSRGDLGSNLRSVWLNNYQMLVTLRRELPKNAIAERSLLTQVVVDLNGAIVANVTAPCRTDKNGILVN